MFGQTGMNYLVGNRHLRGPARPGSMGRPYPGHQVAVIDDAGQPVGTGETGEIALNRLDIHGFPDPILFLGYRSEEHTSELQSLMRNSYAVFCLKKKKNTHTNTTKHIKTPTHRNTVYTTSDTIHTE